MVEIRIQSYLTFPTDLAREMCSWPEYIRGEGYSVDLRDSTTSEVVSVRYVDDENDYVVVRSDAPGQLFDRVVGRVVDAMSHHSDNLLVYRRD